MKIVNIKTVSLLPNELASRPEYKNKKVEIGCYEITNIKELEEFIKNPPFTLRRNINDFIKFHPKDHIYLSTLINSNDKINKVELEKKIFSIIFKSKTKNMIDYWVCRGWSIEEATIKVASIQSGFSKKGHIVSNHKSRYNTNIEYWIKKGFSESVAEQKLKERQHTFSLKKCIKKYGEEKGTRVFTKRQLKWVESLYNGKTKDEIVAFEKSKMVNFGIASKSSLKVFIPLIEWLHATYTDVEYHVGYKNKQEYCLFNEEKQTVFFYDFAIPSKKVLIEFNGHAWHPKNDAWKPLSFISDSKEHIQNKEKLKEETAINAGFKVLIIWDTDAPEVNLKKCINFITSHG